MYHLVNIVDRNDQTLENVSTLLSLTQVKLGATNSNIVTMLNKVLHTFLERQQARTSFYQCNVIH